jgi:hypothetical protein
LHGNSHVLLPPVIELNVRQAFDDSNGAIDNIASDFLEGLPFLRIVQGPANLRPRRAQRIFVAEDSAVRRARSEGAKVILQFPRSPQIQRARAGAEGRSALTGNANKARIIVHPARRGRINRAGANRREHEWEEGGRNRSNCKRSSH